MKVLVCGSRGWDRPDLVGRRLAQLPEGTTIIHGKCPKGADLHAALHLRTLGFNEIACPADWKRHGKRAGHIRNVEMLDHEPVLVIAFWDGESAGTRDMIDAARGRSIAVEIHKRRIADAAQLRLV